MVLDRKRLVTGILALGVLLFLMALSASPAWAHADPGTRQSSSSAQYQYSQQQQQQQIINVPNKPLPNTGGFPPLLAVGFFVVAGVGLGTALLRRSF